MLQLPGGRGDGGGGANDLTVPDEFDGWPFEARAFVLAEANTALELREETCDHVGMSFEKEPGQAGQFTKAEMAVLVMALGGPNGVTRRERPRPPVRALLGVRADRLPRRRGVRR